MTMDSRVTNALQTTKARYIDVAKRDIMNAVHSFQDLTPDTETFEFPDRSRKLTFRLKGTIPVAYKGNSYNIPVALYLLDSHPYYPPICYVCPTPEMMVKVSTSVDDKGKIYLPYLTEWRYPGYDLIGLLQVMTITFQESCPVFARPTPQQQQQQQRTAIPTPYPSYTPYPSTGVGNRMPMPQQPSATPYPIGGGIPQPTPATYQRPTYPPYPSSSQQPVSTSTTPQYPTYGTAAAQQQSTGTIQPETFRASVLSEIENRLKQRLRDKYGIEHAEMASLIQTQQELRNGQQKLKAMLERLDMEQSELETIVTRYQDKRDEFERVLAAMPADDQLPIDKAIETSTPLHRQLLNCYVQDCVIDDSIYYLGQALKKGVIGLDVYLKHVRELSRDQFLARATMQKCRQKAGLSI